MLADILFKVSNDHLLKPDSARIMREIMERCATGQQRLKGKLPAATVVAHKTGSDDATINDVGVIALPEGRGDMIIAVLSSGQTKPESVSEGVIADVSRAAFDYFALKH